MKRIYSVTIEQTERSVFQYEVIASDEDQAEELAFDKHSLNDKPRELLELEAVATKIEEEGEYDNEDR